VHRVVITGIGVASPIGCGHNKFWSHLIEGHSGVGTISLFDASAFPVRIGAEVKDLDIDSVIKRFPEAQGVRDRKVYLALLAAQEALTDACTEESDPVRGITSYRCWIGSVLAKRSDSLCLLRRYWAVTCDFPSG